MKDNDTPKRIMRRRGRPRKSTTENSPTRKTRTLRLTEEEVKLITENARRCHKNFSEYCRQVLMGYKPGVPDPLKRRVLKITKEALLMKRFFCRWDTRIIGCEIVCNRKQLTA